MHVFLKDKKGATAIEYSLIAAGIAMALFIAVFGFGDTMQAFYDELSGLLTERSI